MGVDRRSAAGAAVYAAAYIGTAAALESSAFPHGFTPWYPPAGITLAFLLLAGTGLPAVAVAFGVRLLNTAVVFPDAWRDEPDGVLVRAVAITACYAAGAWALRRVELHHVRLRELGWFAVVGVAAVPFGASAAVAAVEVVLLESTASDAFDAAFTFWVGDAIAVASIVPAVLLVAAARRGMVTPPRLPPSRSARIETVLQAGALILVPVLAIAVSQSNGQTAYLTLAIIPVAWVALRRDLVLAAVGLLVLTATLSVAAARSLDEDIALAEIQAVLLAAALAALYIAAATHGQEMAHADLLESEERYRSVVGSAPDLVARLDRDGTVRFASEPSWVAGAGGAGAVLEELRARWDEATAGLPEGGVRTIEWESPATDGTRSYSARLGPELRADGTVDGYIAVVSDLTPQRRAEREREEARRRDPVTGLTNRVTFLALLAGLPSETVANRLGMVVVDLDAFKSVNGMLGHDRGDDILRRVAGRVVDAAAGALGTARVGGDEFAIAFLAGADGGVGIAERLLGDLRTRIELGDHHHQLTASIGVAVGGAAGASAEDVFCDAEAAMHAAKEAGRDRVVVFDAGRRSVTVDRRTAEALLRTRLTERSLVVHYQPAFDLRTGEVHAVEALVRLRGPAGEIVMPDRFIGVAEDTGLDVDLGAIVLDEVVAQLAAWPSTTLVAHVNVTARQLTRDGFAAQVLAACAAAGIAPHRLCLELTETLVMVDPEAAIAALTELRSHGVGAALDDFGTGYSSISYLSRLPVSGLKIDRAFVEGLPDDAQSRALVGLVVGLGDALRLDVIAEGIETEAQAACLVELGCRHGQGFLLARPAPADAITALLLGADGQAGANPVEAAAPASRSTSSGSRRSST